MGPPYRLDFSDTGLRSLYTDLGANLTDREMDVGVRSLAYSGSALRATAAASDRLLESSEMFEALLSRPSLFSAYRTWAGEALPWEAGTPSQTLLNQFDQMVHTWRTAHPAEPQQGEAMLQAIYDWVLDPAGMGMVVDASAPELSLDEIATNRRGDCTEFAKIFLTLSRRAGFSAHPVWVQRDLHGNEVAHIVTGVDIGGTTHLVDPVYGNANAAHQSHSRMSQRELLAWHWNNRAQDIDSARPRQAIRLYTRALNIDPENPHFLTNRGIIRLRLGDASAAQTDFHAALSAVANFHPALFQLGNVEYEAGNYAQAARFYRRAIALAPNNSDYRRNLVLALHYGGDRARARQELQELLRRDPSQADLRPLLRSADS